jgi:hypothetical protein
MASKNNSKTRPPKAVALKPWDQRPRPDAGDNNADLIATARGRALNQWEEFEVSFSYLFYVLIRAREFAILSRAYGSIITFRGKSDLVFAALETQFAIRPDAILERRCKDFKIAVGKYAARRNEIAHGITMPFNVEKDGAIVPGVLLYPSVLAINKRHLVAITSRNQFVTEAKYGYNAEGIMHYSDKFEDLKLTTNEIIELVAASHKKKPKRSKTPK